MDEEINTRTADKGIALETTLCRNGVINCWSDKGSGEVHSVHVNSDGSIDRCTCKGWTHHGKCYHTDTIRSDRSLRMAARATSVAESNPVATDGGRECDHTTDDPEDCLICELQQKYDVGEDTTTDDDGDERPARSEKPDFDRGPSGVDEL